MPLDPNSDPRLREFEPYERARIRDVVESFLRGRWLRGVATRTVAWVTGVLVLVGLFRDTISDVLAALSVAGQ